MIYVLQWRETETEREREGRSRRGGGERGGTATLEATQGGTQASQHNRRVSKRDTVGTAPTRAAACRRRLRTGLCSPAVSQTAGATADAHTGQEVQSAQQENSQCCAQKAPPAPARPAGLRGGRERLGRILGGVVLLINREQATDQQ